MKRLDWKRAFTYMLPLPGWGRELFFGGLWILLCPPIGWPLALGYRREVAFRLIEGRRPYLPGWSGWREMLFAGFRAEGVILTYFLPFMTAFWLLALDGTAAWDHIGAILTFAAAVALLPPLFLPFLPPYLALSAPWMHVTAGEATFLVAMFLATTFVMPAAFMQVSVHQKFRYALNLPRVCRLIAATPRVYVEAWLLSLGASACAVALGPAAPWGIFWSYLVIVYAFNQALVQWPDPAVQSRFALSEEFSGPASVRKIVRAG